MTTCCRFPQLEIKHTMGLWPNVLAESDTRAAGTNRLSLGLGLFVAAVALVVSAVVNAYSTESVTAEEY